MQLCSATIKTVNCFAGSPILCKLYILPKRMWRLQKETCRIWEIPQRRSPLAFVHHLFKYMGYALFPASFPSCWWHRTNTVRRWHGVCEVEDATVQRTPKPFLFAGNVGSIMNEARNYRWKTTLLQIGKLKLLEGINTIPSFSLESLHNSRL